MFLSKRTEVFLLLSVSKQSRITSLWRGYSRFQTLLKYHAWQRTWSLSFRYYHTRGRYRSVSIVATIKLSIHKTKSSLMRIDRCNIYRRDTGNPIAVCIVLHKISNYG